ncbi:MAG: choice-of-anchor I family protein [Sphingobacteriaceae bacterium]|nr:choice-of-anchor I family protein [Sphingobacteriaceae bacterium]
MRIDLRTLLLTLLLLVSSEGMQAQVLRHYWNFNNSATEAELLAPTLGTGTIQHIVGGTSVIQTTSNTGQGFEITNPNARNNDASGTHLRFNNPIGGTLEFSLPTVGLQQITIKYATRRSGSGAGVQYIHYSTDGSNFALFDSIFPVDGNPTMQTLNFSALPAVNNNGNFKLRLTFAAGAAGTVGNNRFDNFTLEGNALPSLVHYWNFNNSSSESTLLTPNIGNGSIQHLQGGISAIAITSNTTGQGFEITNPNARNGDPAGSHLRFNDPIGGALVFSLPTPGVQQVVIKYATRRSGSGAGTQFVHYTTDGTNFQFFDSILPVNGDPSLQTLNFSSLTAVENNANFKIRFTFAAGAGGTVGNNRFDNFTLEGVTANAAVDTFAPIALLFPANNSSGQAVNIRPRITFNESVRLASGQSLTTAIADTVLRLFATASNQTVAFGTQLSGDTITVIPASNLQPGTSYTLQIRDGLLSDLAGNALAAGYQSTFSTLALQTQFQPGDLLPVAYRMNATGTPDAAAFLTFVDILPGTIINVTDAKYTDNTPAQCPGGLVWTAPSTGVSRGTVIVLGTDAGTASIGTLTGSTFGLSSGGDQVILYTGSNTQPAFVSALSANAWVANNTSCGGSFSKLPAGLVDGVSALNLSTAPGNAAGLSVNAYYNGPQIGPAFRDSILLPAYWVVAGSGTPAQTWPNWSFPGPPAVASARVLTNNTLQVAFNQDILFSSLTDTANYTNIPGLVSISGTNNGSLPDTAVLTFNPGFVNGSNYTLVVNNVRNSSNLAMSQPFQFNFAYNTTISFASRYLVVDENVGTVSLPINLQFPSAASFRIRLRSQLTANAQDHGFVAQTVQITGSSQGNQLVQFTINDDILVEDDEYLIFEIDSLQGVQLQGPNYFTLYIRDNDRSMPVRDSAVTMTLVSSFDPSPTGSTTEVVVYDKLSRRLFATSSIENRFDIINFNNPANPTTISSVSMAPYGGLTSIAVKPGLVAVASPNINEQLPGKVVFFDTLGNYISQVTVGSLPDMLVFSPDGNRLLVANEGQPNTTFTVDPEGSVSIINTSGSTITQSNVTTLDFTAFNAQEASLIAAGVRKGSTIGTLSQNLEPEYIAVSDDNTKAWVTLQENNSIAEINLLNNTITSIRGLGLKDNSVPGNGFDASDNIPEVLLVAWPTKMYYMPDALGQFTVGGNTYLVSANEGDEREYSALNERTTVGAASTVLDPMAFPNGDMLKENHAIGRLRITNLNGDNDSDGDYDNLINVGARSFSIWNSQTGTQVWDSKNQLEVITQLDPVFGALFNADHESNTRKNRSRSKGPEPEGLAMAKVGNRHFAFIGLERIGGVVAYEVTDPTAPVFNGYLNPRSVSSVAGDRGAETMIYIAANESANGKPYLVVANEISGTLSIIELSFNVQPQNNSYTLQILHASDMEGGLDAPKDAPNFAAVIDKLEDEFANTVILSSGDNFIPSPFLSAGEDPSLQTPLRNATNLFYPGQHLVRPAIGRPDIAIMNLIGFNASVFGNHEFDLGTGELNSMIGVDIRNNGADKRWVGAQFPYLSANLNFSADVNLNYLVTADGQLDTAFRTPANITNNNQKKGIARSAVIERGGQKIGIVGATTQVLATISSPGATTMVGPSVNDMPALAAILQPVIDSLRFGQGINKIIVLSHLQQLSLEQALAPLLTGVDVIIAGGSHSLLADANDILRPGDVAVGTYPQIRTGANGQPTLLVNTESEYKYVGRLVLAFDSLGVIDTTALNPLINGAYATDSAGVARVWGSYAAGFLPGSKGANVKALTDAVRTVIVAKDGNVFGKSTVFLEGRRELTRTEETNLGNLSSDANLWQARQVDPTVTLSLKNGGGIRQAMGTVNAVGSTVTLQPTAANPAAGKQQGDISQLDIENALRFNNRLSVLTIPVTGIKALLEHGLAQTAPGATPGRFPQVGGMAFSYDPTLPVNSRIRSLVRIDSAGNTVDTLVRNGQIHGNPARTYKMVTLNFLAGGGDGYPFAPYAATRVDLDTVLTAAGGATFTVPGSEQDAFAEYMLVKHPAATPYAVADRPAALDTRIQDLSRRNDSLLPFDIATLLTPANNSRLVTNPGNTTAVQISWLRALNAQSYKWSLTTAAGNFAPGLVNLLSNNNGTDTVLTLTVGAIDNLLASLGVAAGDSIDTRWTVKAFYRNGSDSTLAMPFNLRLVRQPVQLGAFNLVGPANNSRVFTEPTNNTPIVINWQQSANALTYEWLVDFPTGNFSAPILTLPAANAGADSFLVLLNRSVDSLLQSFLVNPGDSSELIWTVRATNGNVSRLASAPFNIRLVRSAQIAAFSLIGPANNARVEVRGPASTPVIITWQAATSLATAPIRYTWLADPAANFNSPLLNFSSDNAGAATQLSLTTGAIDTILANAGIVIGDSVTLQWTVEARTGVSSRLASSTFSVRLIRVGLTSSVEALNQVQLKLYPNPATDRVHIRTAGVIMETITVYSLNGSEMLKLQPQTNEAAIELAHFAAGTYLVRIQTPVGVINRRLVINR